MSEQKIAKACRVKGTGEGIVMNEAIAIMAVKRETSTYDLIFSFEKLFSFIASPRRKILTYVIKKVK